MTRRDEQLKSATAAWTARRMPRTPLTRESAVMAEARADAFRCFADVEFGEAEALLRVERAA